MCQGQVKGIYKKIIIAYSTDNLEFFWYKYVPHFDKQLNYRGKYLYLREQPCSKWYYQHLNKTKETNILYIQFCFDLASVSPKSQLKEYKRLYCWNN